MQGMKQTIVRMCQGLCVIAVVAVIATGAVLVTKPSPSTALAADSQTAESSSASNAAATPQSTQPTATLQSQLDAIVAGNPDLEISIVAMDAASGWYVSSGEAVPFKAASITKVISACAYLQKVQQGSASLDTTIQSSTAHSLIQRMLTNSDNVALAAINGYLGKDVVQQYAANSSLSTYDVYANTIDAKDQAAFLAKLANGELLSQPHTALLKSFMRHTNNDELIPAGAPTGATTYHKYGYLDGYLHDSAIIEYGGKTYTLAILTKNSTGSLDDYATRTNVFRNATRAVTSHMERS